MAAGHEARQIGLALDHLRRRRPVRPLLLVGDVHQPLPLKTVAADADAVADRATARLHQIEMPFGGRDDEGAGRFGGTEVDDLLLPLRIEFEGIVGDQARLVAAVGLLGVGMGRGQDQADRSHKHPGQTTKIRHFKLSPTAKAKTIWNHQI
jgi:hypothetical protein